MALIATLAAAAGCGGPTVDGTPVPTPGEPKVSVQAEFLVSVTVERVIDGSTILVSREGESFEVRYLGIEIPDSSSAAATEQNRHLVEGRTVELEIDVVQADGFGRALRYVYVDGEMVNEILLANGHAVVSGFPNEFRYRDRLVVAQERARALSRGVWAVTARPSASDTETPDQTTATGSATAGPAATPRPFTGGTLPSLPDGETFDICDFTGTPQPVIKGVVDPITGDRVYHMPGDVSYPKKDVDVTRGDAWLCTETDAVAAGWVPALG